MLFPSGFLFKDPRFSLSPTDLLKAEEGSVEHALTSFHTGCGNPAGRMYQIVRGWSLRGLGEDQFLWSVFCIGFMGLEGVCTAFVEHNQQRPCVLEANLRFGCLRSKAAGGDLWYSGERDKDWKMLSV